MSTIATSLSPSLWFTADVFFPTTLRPTRSSRGADNKTCRSIQLSSNSSRYIQNNSSERQADTDDTDSDDSSQTAQSTNNSDGNDADVSSSSSSCSSRSSTPGADAHARGDTLVDYIAAPEIPTSQVGFPRRDKDDVEVSKASSSSKTSPPSSDSNLSQEDETDSPPERPPLSPCLSRLHAVFRPIGIDTSQQGEAATGTADGALEALLSSAAESRMCEETGEYVCYPVYAATDSLPLQGAGIKSSHTEETEYSALCATCDSGRLSPLIKPNCGSDYTSGCGTGSSDDRVFRGNNFSRGVKRGIDKFLQSGVLFEGCTITKEQCDTYRTMNYEFPKRRRFNDSDSSDGLYCTR